MHHFEVVVGGETRTVEADTWRRDLATHEVVFIERIQDEADPTLEREVARLYVEDPHRNIKRL